MHKDRGRTSSRERQREKGGGCRLSFVYSCYLICYFCPMIIKHCCYTFIIDQINKTKRAFVNPFVRFTDQDPLSVMCTFPTPAIHRCMQTRRARSRVGLHFSSLRLAGRRCVMADAALRGAAYRCGFHSCWRTRAHVNAGKTFWMNSTPD